MSHAVSDAETTVLAAQLADRLEVKETTNEQYEYDEDDDKDEDVCLAALYGEKLPPSLSLRSRTIRCCVVRGIRFTLHGFGSELRGLKEFPQFTRALNARAIMSNTIPDMDHPNEVPYCFWHPDIPSEQTLRDLVERYPQLRYHVGRACAVGGYTALYQSLDLLPDVSIAEEARDNGSREIYDSIMAAPVKYAIMDDYTRRVYLDTPNSRAGAHLNGDTCVYSTLNVRQSYYYVFVRWEEQSPSYQHYNFNIAEDLQIDEQGSSEDGKSNIVPISKTAIELLTSPLPQDLPTTDKDILILMAAYYGDIDRYRRLRRPGLVTGETECVIRGIYHNPMFAKWVSTLKVPGAMLYEYSDSIEPAISARFLMNGDLSRITDDLSELELPYLIWYPTVPPLSVLKELLRRKPIMKQSIALAAIAGGFKDLYLQINPKPVLELFEVAEKSPHAFFKEDLEHRKKEEEAGRSNDLGDNYEWSDYPPPWMEQYELLWREMGCACMGDVIGNRSLGGTDHGIDLPRALTLNHVGFATPIDGGGQAYGKLGTVQLFVSAPEHLRPPAGYMKRDLGFVYDEMGEKGENGWDQMAGLSKY